MPGPELLVLARHAQPVVDPSIARDEWPLSPEGIDAARRMGRRWVDLGLALVVSSTERKARETAVAAADELALPFHTGHDLHEHERPFVADRAAFERALREFFADPSQSAAVERRFTTALDRLVAAHRAERLAVVTHGTVLSLHLAARYAVDGWRTWQALGVPSYAVVETRTKTLVDLVTEV